MRELIKTHDDEQGEEIQARQKPMFEESTIVRENAYQAIEAPRVQTRPTISSFDTFSQSMVGCGEDRKIFILTMTNYHF